MSRIVFISGGFQVHWRLILSSLLLITWPLAWKYTSVGLDVETANGPITECTYYRVRWPGDGSIMFGRIDEPRRADRKPYEHYDLGGLFFAPAQTLHPQSIWQRLGFRWVDYDRTRDAGPCDVSPHAARARLIGFPHVLLIIATAGWAIFVRGRRGSAMIEDDRA